MTGLALVILLALAAAAVVFLAARARHPRRGPAQGSAPERPEPGTTETAEDDPGGEWRAEVLLEQISERAPDYEVSRLSVVLRNARGREVETPEVGFQVGGEPLIYRVGQGNYYDRHPYYRLDDDSGLLLVPGTAYALSVTRGTGPPVPFAELRMPEPMSAASFDLPSAHPAGRELTLAWAGLRQPADVLIYRTLTTTDASGNQTIEAGGPYGDDVLRHRIGAGGAPLAAGRLAVPAPYLAPRGGGVVTDLTVVITSGGAGRFLHPVLARSAIGVRRKVVLRTDILPAH